MEKCNIAELTDRGVVAVTGSEAHRLLQDVVTNDIARARDGHAVHAALLTPQGKILFDFFLLDRGDCIFLECPRDVVSELIKRLTFYKLRADVTFEDVSPSHAVWAAWGDTPEIPEGAMGYADPRLSELGYRIIAANGVEPVSGCTVLSADDYHAHRIGLGVPEGGKDYPLGDTFPHEADYDQLNGVDFKKGCYVGQEVVSRMQHRGTARKRIVPVKADADIHAGADIVAGESTIGKVGTVSGNRALAMVRLDRAEKAIAEGRPLVAGDVDVHLHQPDWAEFNVPSGDNQHE